MALRNNINSLLRVHPVNVFCEGNETRLKECPREEFSLDQFPATDDIFRVAVVRCQGSYRYCVR